ncbi:hypothetical protein F4553_002188 [Allocatelliglobosispora scoriae]|uniref:Uncharacterized protein n=1 Tax=Allocatelliglobosispora scoriae TaxID=643052 RepID=A0A841BNN4_9ACTN|nr:CU044_5270 family protein [Allocatelliglobosispora scoriae]MBB5868809.1 hypothetical protein [Allocatelliglobosispora scoriae]
MSTHRDTLRALTEARPARLDPDTPPVDPSTITAYPRDSREAARHLPTRRLVLAGGALAAVAAVGVTVAVRPGTAPPRSGTGPGTSAVAAPTSAADWLLVAAESSATAAHRSGRYWVLRHEEGGRDRPALVVEQWLATVDRLASTAYFRDPAGGTWTPRAMRGHTAANNFLLAGEGRSARTLAALPARPDQLRTALLAWYARTGHLDGDQSEFLFYCASALVLNLPVGPEIRSAAYRMLAGVPGITALGRVTDATGRTGVAVAISHRGDGGALGQTRLIIDPATGTALAEERWTDGVRSSYTALLAAGWSDADLPDAADLH